MFFDIHSGCGSASGTPHNRFDLSIVQLSARHETQQSGCADRNPKVAHLITYYQGKPPTRRHDLLQLLKYLIHPTEILSNHAMIQTLET